MIRGCFMCRLAKIKIHGPRADDEAVRGDKSGQGGLSWLGICMHAPDVNQLHAVRTRLSRSICYTTYITWGTIWLYEEDSPWVMIELTRVWVCEFWRCLGTTLSLLFFFTSETTFFKELEILILTCTRSEKTPLQVLRFRFRVNKLVNLVN